MWYVLNPVTHSRRGIIYTVHVFISFYCLTVNPFTLWELLAFTHQTVLTCAVFKAAGGSFQDKLH